MAYIKRFELDENERVLLQMELEHAIEENEDYIKSLSSNKTYDPICEWARNYIEHLKALNDKLHKGTPID